MIRRPQQPMVGVACRRESLSCATLETSRSLMEARFSPPLPFGQNLPIPRLMQHGNDDDALLVCLVEQPIGKSMKRDTPKGAVTT